MNPYGKIIGAIIGLLVYPAYGLGLFLGVALGHYFLDRHKPDAKTKETIRNLKYYLKSRKHKLTLRHLFSKNQSFSGKAFVGIIGLSFFGWLGLIIGLALGHIFLDCNDFSPDDILKEAFERLLDKTNTKELLNPLRNIAKSSEAKNVALLKNIASLAAKLAKVDGAVVKEEVKAFKNSFNISQKDYHKIANAFDNAKKTADGFEDYAKQIYILSKKNKKKLTKVIETLFIVAKADDDINNNELDFIKKTSYIFGFDNDTFNSIYEMFIAPEATTRNINKNNKNIDPYKILSITPSASNAEVKKAWKKLIREYHPDILSSKGLSQKKLEMATQKMAEINVAYDKILSDRGLK